MTMATVRMPRALAAAATTGAAPLPVPPPMPACNTAFADMSSPHANAMHCRFTCHDSNSHRKIHLFKNASWVRK